MAPSVCRCTRVVSNQPVLLNHTKLYWPLKPWVGSCTPWLPVNPNHEVINAAAQVDDPASVFSWYRALIALRRELPVVAHGDFVPLASEDQQLWAFLRRLDDARLLVLVNVSDEPVAVDLTALSQELGESPWQPTDLVLGTHESPAPTTLRPWEAALWWL